MPSSVVGLTQASTVIAFVRFSDEDDGIVTRSFSPSKLSPWPYFPAVRVAPEIVPVLPLAVLSYAVLPLVSSKLQAPTSPGTVTGGAGVGVGVGVASASGRRGRRRSRSAWRLGRVGVAVGVGSAWASAPEHAVVLRVEHRLRTVGLVAGSVDRRQPDRSTSSPHVRPVTV